MASPALAHDADDALTEASYTDTDAVALLIDGSGAIADNHPSVVRELGFEEGGAGIPSEVIESLTSTLQTEIPSFHEEVTVALTSGDPFKVEASLRAMEENIGEVGKVLSAGTGVGYCVVNPLVFIDTFGALVQLVAYDTNAFWGRSNSYWLTTAQTTDFGVQDLSAKIASEIR